MISPYSLSVPGGVQAQVMGLSRELRAMGYEVRVLAPCDGPPPATFVTPLGNSLPTSANGSIAPLAPDPACQLRTIRALTEEEFDVIHLHEPFLPGPPQTTLLLRTAPIIATFHSAGESASYRYLGRLLLRAAENLGHRVAVSKDARELVHRYIGGEYEILFNGVELEDYRSSPSVATTGPTIFFCARHEERKGLDVLLRAMQLLPADVTLWVGSNGPDTDRLRSEFVHDPRVVWLGRMTDADKIAHLKGADVFCAPSLHGESFGVVLVEAMAAGTTIVASSLDGYRNVATDGVDAVLVDPGDVEELAKALAEVLANPQKRTQLTEAGQMRANDFSMSTLAQHYAAHYERLAAADASRPDGASKPRPRASLTRMMTTWLSGLSSASSSSWRSSRSSRTTD
jgi:phosphatidylinositol alpha-mannosyltransferase